MNLANTEYLLWPVASYAACWAALSYSLWIPMRWLINLCGSARLCTFSARALDKPSRDAVRMPLDGWTVEEVGEGFFPRNVAIKVSDEAVCCVMAEGAHAVLNHIGWVVIRWANVPDARAECG